MTTDMSPIEEAYSAHSIQQVGNKREVWKVSPEGLPNGKVGDGVFVKDRTTGPELETLKFIQKLGIGEELLAYDDKKIVVRRQKGSHFDEYKSRFMKHAHTRQLDQDNDSTDSGFIMESITEIIPADNVIEADGEAADFTSSFLASNIFLMVNGIFHDDIKSDNIIVMDGEPVLIDFGETVLAESNNSRLKWTNNFRKVFLLIADLHRDFTETLVALSQPESTTLEFQPPGYSVVEDLYKQIEPMDLQDRPKIVAEYFSDVSRLDLLAEELKIPQNIRLDVIAKIKRFIDISQ